MYKSTKRGRYLLGDEALILRAASKERVEREDGGRPMQHVDQHEHLGLHAALEALLEKEYGVLHNHSIISDVRRSGV